MTECIKHARNLFKEIMNLPIDTVELIANSASNRVYVRLTTKDKTYIGTMGEQPEENNAFIRLSDHLRAQGIHVPCVLSVSTDGNSYVQEDLGDLSLYNLLTTSIADSSFPDSQIQWLEQSLFHLLKFQHKGIVGLDLSVCYPRSSFDRRSIVWDLNYFKYSFLKPSLSSFLEDRLEDEFDLLTEALLSVPANVLVHRDFQSRNILIHNDTPYIIDFQGARKGAIYYDLASFVFQTRIALPEELQIRLIEAYREKLSDYQTVDKEEFYSSLYLFGLFRTIQLLGAYGYRGLFERKEAFTANIYPTICQLERFLFLTSIDLPYLKSLIPTLKKRDSDNQETHIIDNSKLTVDLYSFSYKKGIPDDTSGNGGGFVFDCRAIHNPGRYDEYKSLTGRDQEVINFLEKQGEVLHFLKTAYTLAETSVERYIERGFSHVQFAFGCTGGQHRSVYCAERLAQHISLKYGVKVRLTHREQGFFTEYPHHFTRH